MDSTSYKNYSIKELESLDQLSRRSINCCLENNLGNLSRLLKYFESNKSFRSLSNCGETTDKELQRVCKKYLDLRNDVVLTPELRFNYSIEKLLKSRRISVRSANSCNHSGLKDLSDIIEYYKQFNSFIELRNCGHLTNLELISLAEDAMFYIPELHKYSLKNYIIAHLDLDTDNILSNITSKFLSKFDLNIYEEIPLFDNYIKNCDVPLFKIIQIIIEKSLSPVKHDIFKNIIISDISTLQEIGDKHGLSRERIRQLRNEILNDLFSRQLIRFLKDLFLDYLNPQLFFTKDFHVIKNEEIEELRLYQSTIFPTSIILKLFELLNPDYTLLNNSTTKKTHLTNYYFAHNVLNYSIIINFIEYLNNLQRKTDLTLSRSVILSAIFPKFKIAYKKLCKRISVLIKSRDVLIANETNQINKNLLNLLYREKSNIIYTKSGKILIEEGIRFNAQIIGLISKHLICDCVLTNKKGTNLKVALLLEDYSSRLKDIHQDSFFIVRKEINEVLSGFEPYLKAFRKISEVEYNFKWKRNILYINRNTPKAKHEILIDILEENQAPMHINEIFSKLKIVDPMLFPNIISIRSIVIKHNEFITFGRSSTYGLRIWQEKKDDLMGGTIRSIAEAFLSTSAEPIHIDKLVEHILRYRGTNTKSVISNLKAINKAESPFIFFKNGFIGLKRK